MNVRHGRSFRSAGSADVQRVSLIACPFGIHRCRLRTPVPTKQPPGVLLIDCMPRLRAFVRRLVGDRETEEELLQEISLRALAGEGPSEEEFFLAWSCGIARHVIGIEWRRRRRARAELSIEDEGLADELCDPMAFPDTCVAARESLIHAMNDLDPGGLELLIRRYILGKGRQGSGGGDGFEPGGSSHALDAIAHHAQNPARRI